MHKAFWCKKRNKALNLGLPRGTAIEDLTISFTDIEEDLKTQILGLDPEWYSNPDQHQRMHCTSC